MALLFVPASFILDIHRGSWGNAALFETCRCFDVSLFPSTASFLFHKMSEKLSIPSILSTSSSTIHPPFKLSRHMAIIFPSLLTVLLPWTVLDSSTHFGWSLGMVVVGSSLGFSPSQQAGILPSLLVAPSYHKLPLRLLLGRLHLWINRRARRRLLHEVHLLGVRSVDGVLPVYILHG